MNHFTKTAGAIAALALIAPTLAQAADPTYAISGYLDLGAFHDYDGDNKLGSIARSNLAFSGGKQLDNGMSVTFKLSARFDMDSGRSEGEGSKPFWQGESSLGLKGSFGHRRLGRALDVISNNDWAFDPWGNGDRIASPAWQMWHYNYATDRTANNGNAEYGRLGNGIFYDSPTVGGFSLSYSGAFEKSTAAGGGRGANNGLALKYGASNVNAMLGYSRNSSGDTVTFLGGQVGLGALSLMGAYDESTYKAATTSKAKVYILGATYTLDKTTLRLGYGHLGGDVAKTDFIGAGASYALDKSLTTYLSVGNSKVSGGSGNTAYGVGMAYSF